MADGLILEFDSYGADAYRRVSEALGIDVETGEGNWPDGLLSHIAAAKEGGFLVLEIWRSKDDQERFMAGRLASALKAGGVDAVPSRAEWLDLTAHHEHPEQA